MLNDQVFFIRFIQSLLFIYLYKRKEHNSAIDEYFNSTQTPAKGQTTAQSLGET